ncbi:MAG: flagellar hook-length control protein FliK, partial [Thermodesulfobacteriota bacterium]
GSEAGRQQAGAEANPNQAKAEGLAAPAAAERAGGAAAAGPARAALPAHVVRQVGDQMAQMVIRQQNTLRLELKPPSLGELHMELTVKEGVVKATLTAETVAAKQALEAGLEQLKQELAQQGLKVERIDIAVNPDAERREAQAQAQAGFGQRRGRGQAQAAAVGGAATTEDETALPAWRPGPASGRVNLFA